MVARNIVKLCTAALAGSIIGIAYERLPDNLASSFSSVLASVPSVPRKNSDVPLVPSNLDINPKTSGQNLKESSRYGLPSKDNIRVFNDFILSYDRRLRAPLWVIEHLTLDKLEPRDGVNRTRSRFLEDKTLHEYFRAKNGDYSHSGFDRGHLAAAGNHKVSQDDMDQTFFLSNILPQVPEFNRGGWERLETYVRWRAKRNKNLWVVTGPLYLPHRASNGNLYVTYQVIGDSHVSVPTHYFKVFLIETHEGSLELEAFLMPNSPRVTDDVKLDDYRVPLDRLDVIERASGIIFFDQLIRNKLDAPVRVPPEFKQVSRSALRSSKDNADSPSDSK